VISQVAVRRREEGARRQKRKRREGGHIPVSPLFLSPNAVPYRNHAVSRYDVTTTSHSWLIPQPMAFTLSPPSYLASPRLL